ncbi:hypothetical protein [Streptomyces rochei]|uniref:hypothetical protein n=1 Tax=Streptomyces rochei TaxID=1928 RepID=UPI0040396182
MSADGPTPAEPSPSGQGPGQPPGGPGRGGGAEPSGVDLARVALPVSYTHLTLPTS